MEVTCPLSLHGSQMPGLPVRPIKTPSCILDGQLKETLWRLWAEPPLAPLHPHIFISFFYSSNDRAVSLPISTVRSHIYEQKSLFKGPVTMFSWCLINSQQNCFIALTSVHGAHILPGELQGYLPPLESQDLTVSASVSKFSSCGSSSHDLDPSQTRVMNQMTLDFGWQN